MNILFGPACSQAGFISITALTGILADYRQRASTGLLQLIPSSDYLLALLVVKGNLHSIYRCTPYEVQQFNSEQWPEIAAHLSTLRVCSLLLDPRSIRIARILLEEANRKQMQAIEKSGLFRQLGTWADYPLPSLIYCQCQSAEGAFVLPGGRRPPVDSIWATDQLLEGVNILEPIKNLCEPSIQVARYEANFRGNAWLEYGLHAAFTRLVNGCLQRCTELAGSALALSLSRAAGLKAMQQGWDIRFENLTVVDDELFQNPEAAILAYRSLTSTVVHHIYAVVGRALMENALQQIFQELDLTSVRFIHQYSLLPPSMLIQINTGYLK